MPTWRQIARVLLLKWAREFQFDITWNLLCGFPGERPEDYEETARLIPLITHLQPPSSVSRFRLDRFSPMFENPEKYGITEVAPFSRIKRPRSLNRSGDATPIWAWPSYEARACPSSEFLRNRARQNKGGPGASVG